MPVFVVDCWNLIEKNIGTEGIFSREPTPKDADLLEKEFINKGNVSVGLNKYSDNVYVLATVLKRFLRQLIQKILTEDITREIIKTEGNIRLNMHLHK